MAYSVVACNQALDAITVDRVSLHSGDPGLTGANYISGGGKQVASFAAAASSQRLLNSDVMFTGLGATVPVTHFGIWLNAGDVYKGGQALTGDQTSNAAGEYTLKAGGAAKMTAV